jgi:hypothetical protein
MTARRPARTRVARRGRRSGRRLRLAFERRPDRVGGDGGAVVLEWHAVRTGLVRTGSAGVSG